MTTDFGMKTRPQRKATTKVQGAAASAAAQQKPWNHAPKRGRPRKTPTAVNAPTTSDTAPSRRKRQKRIASALDDGRQLKITGSTQPIAQDTPATTERGNKREYPGSRATGESAPVPSTGNSFQSSKTSSGRTKETQIPSQATLDSQRTEHVVEQTAPGPSAHGVTIPHSRMVMFTIGEARQLLGYLEMHSSRAATAFETDQLIQIRTGEIPAYPITCPYHLGGRGRYGPKVPPASPKPEETPTSQYARPSLKSGTVLKLDDPLPDEVSSSSSAGASLLASEPSKHARGSSAYSDTSCTSQESFTRYTFKSTNARRQQVADGLSNNASYVPLEDAPFPQPEPASMTSQQPNDTFNQSEDEPPFDRHYLANYRSRTGAHSDKYFAEAAEGYLSSLENQQDILNDWPGLRAVYEYEYGNASIDRDRIRRNNRYNTSSSTSRSQRTTTTSYRPKNASRSRSCSYSDCSYEELSGTSRTPWEENYRFDFGAWQGNKLNQVPESYRRTLENNKVVLHKRPYLIDVFRYWNAKMGRIGRF